VTRDWTAGVRSPLEAEHFSSSLCVQTGSEAHPASYTMGTGCSFTGGKARKGRDADHSHSSCAEVKIEWELYLLSPKAPPWRVTGQLSFFLYNVLTYLKLKILRISDFTMFVFDIIAFISCMWVGYLFGTLSREFSLILYRPAACDSICTHFLLTYVSVILPYDLLLTF
jgi:hypothetical protein